MVRGCDDHELFVIKRELFERRIGDGFRHQRCVELSFAHRGCKLPRCADAQLQADLGIAGEVLVHRYRQPHRRRAFHGAETQAAARLGILQGLARLLRKIEQPVGVVEQQLALGGEVQLLALADEERNAEIGLELAYARGHVGLDAVELFRRPRHTPGLHHGAEDIEIGQVHGGRLCSFSDRDHNHHNYSFYVMLWPE